MSGQGIFCHQLLSNLPRKRRFETPFDVDLGKLLLFELDVIAQLLAFARKIRTFGVGLRADGNILAGSHRHGASHQSRDACDQDSVLRCGRRGDADNQTRSRDDAIVSPEHCGSQPPDTADEVLLGM